MARRMAGMAGMGRAWAGQLYDLKRLDFWIRCKRCYKNSSRDVPHQWCLGKGEVLSLCSRNVAEKEQDLAKTFAPEAAQDK